MSKPNDITELREQPLDATDKRPNTLRAEQPEIPFVGDTKELTMKNGAELLKQ